MKRMASQAKEYFMSEQIGCKGMDDCDHPWHASTKAGYPVPFSTYVFPGGTDARFETTSTVPTSGDRYVLTMSDMKAEVEGVSGKRARELMVEAFGVPVGEELYFKYVYTTGSGTGPDATATIKAIADFDPSTPEKHTVVQTLKINDQQQVEVGYPVTEHEFE